MFHLCSHSALESQLKDGDGVDYRPGNSALTPTLAVRRQAMRQAIPTLWLQQTCCGPDGKGGSLDHLPPN